MTRDELMRATQEAVASYKACAASAETARQMLALGMGSLPDVVAKSYLESNARARWLALAEQLALVTPTAPAPNPTPRAPAVAPKVPATRPNPTKPATRPTQTAPAVAPKANARSGSTAFLAFLNDQVEGNEKDWRLRHALRSAIQTTRRT
jgi:hypothetical protein